MILSILGSIGAIWLVVFVHELGHFLVARLCRVKVLKFSIGFGPALWSCTSQKTGTVYALSLIPFGGYVKMCDEQRIQVGLRILIALAGPLANLLLAVFLFSIEARLGITYIKPIVGRVTPGSIAASAGIHTGDQWIQVGGEPVYDWGQVMMVLLPHVGDSKPLKIITTRTHSLHYHQLNLSAWRINGHKLDMLHVLGIAPYYPAGLPIISKVIPHSPAALAGLHPHDYILKINHTKINTWSDVVNNVQTLLHHKVSILVQRGHQQRWVIVYLTDYLGVITELPALPYSLIHTIHYHAFAATQEGMKQVWHLLCLNFKLLYKMVTGHVSLNTLSGPISIFQTAGEASRLSLCVYLNFIGFISIALGFINLLPIPLLDGGYVFLGLIEFATGRPIAVRYQLIAMKLGFFLLLYLTLRATFNDILNLL